MRLVIQRGARNITINNAATGVIRSEGDAIRIDNDFSEGEVVVNNSGLIDSLISGQAIDFRSISSAGTENATVVIDNLASGIIRAEGADAIRPGQGAVVNNSGLIEANGLDDDKHDAIDFQESSGTVNNLTGGIISGQRHGIATDTDVTVFNAEGGLIVGRNGSGINSDRDGTVINYGTIRGEAIGTVNADPDAIDIDRIGNIENLGLIEAAEAIGVDSRGDINVSEAVTVQRGGSFINHETGIVRGAQVGVNIFSTPLNEARIVNHGLIEGGTVAVALQGTGESVFTNSGTVSSDNFAIRATTPVSTIIIQEGSIINGRVRGSVEGHETIILEEGAVFNTAEEIDLLRVEGDATIFGITSATQIEVDEGAVLSLGQGGETGQLVGNIFNEGDIIIDRSDVFAFRNIVEGSGRIIKLGDNLVAITAISGYSGDTIISEGTLRVDRAIANSTFIVEAGGTLTGVGTVGGIEWRGGVIAPDLAFGVLNVAGDVTLDEETTYLINVDSNGQSNQIAATGAVDLGGSTLLINAEGENFTVADYQIITAANGVTNTFGDVISNFAFLDAELTYNDNDVILTLARNGREFNQFARNANEVAVANAVAEAGVGTGLFDQTLQLSAEDAANGFKNLSGELYAGLGSALFNQSYETRRAIEFRDVDVTPEGRSVWTTGVVGTLDVEGSAETRAIDGTHKSAIGGISYGGGNISVKLGGGLGGAKYNNDDEADIDSLTGLGAVLYENGALNLQAGAVLSSHDVSAQRDTTVGAVSSRTLSETEFTALNLFARASYAVDIGRLAVAPFADISNIVLDRDGFEESGGDAALASVKNSRSVSFGKIGVSLSGRATEDTSDVVVHPYLNAAYRQSWGDRAGTETFRFVETDTAFTVVGNSLDRNALDLDLGLNVSKQSWSVSASYGLVTGDNVTSHTGRLRIGVDF